MWKCPKCGRTFKNENQSHYCGKTPETVDEYILSQDEAIRGQLERVRNVLRASLPDAVTYFAEKLHQAGCKYSKGSIQIPYSDDLPLDLIAEIADWCRKTGNHA